MRQIINGFLIFWFGMKSVYAVDCMAIVAKDTCWQSFNTNVSIYDSSNNALLATAILPIGQSFSKVEFTCQANQVLKVTANYNPKITDNDAPLYQLSHFIILPSQESSPQAKWEFNICFGVDFVELPLPPTATGNCQCQFDKIPSD